MYRGMLGLIKGKTRLTLEIAERGWHTTPCRLIHRRQAGKDALLRVHDRVHVDTQIMCLPSCSATNEHRHTELSHSVGCSFGICLPFWSWVCPLAAASLNCREFGNQVARESKQHHAKPISVRPNLGLKPSVMSLQSRARPAVVAIKCNAIGPVFTHVRFAGILIYGFNGDGQACRCSFRYFFGELSTNPM